MTSTPHDPRTATTDRPIIGRAEAGDGPSGLLALLLAWLPGQRWFPAKGASDALPHVAVVEPVDPAGEAEVRLELFRLPQGGLLQVPVVLRPDDGTPRAGLIGSLPDGRLVVDGPHDPAMLRAWLAAAEHADPRPDGPLADHDLRDARVMTGEQSNTSVLLPRADPPAILKVFRTVGVGPNPDVEVPLALSRVGWTGVPRPLAWLTASWPVDGGSDAAVGHLGVLSELVLGADDGFELACRWAREGIDFADLAGDLGRTTAQMHRALRTALPTGGSPRTTDVRAAAAHGVHRVLHERALAAISAAPVLESRRDAVEAALLRVGQLDSLPPLQRVHGDYHLGQVLRSPDRGWVVLDFEGEPQASAAERTRPDLALRDLAGMLRSLDYAAAVGGATSPSWLPDARAALVAAYRAEDGQAPAAPNAPQDDVVQLDATTSALLRALELDKALYEVVYETRNRPDWVAIPLAGVDRLLAGE